MGKRIPLELIAQRRKIVAQLISQGYRQHEVVSLIQMEYIMIDEKKIENPHYMVNPNTGEGFDKATISRDYKALKTRWRKQSDELVKDVMREKVGFALEGLMKTYTGVH